MAASRLSPTITGISLLQGSSVIIEWSNAPDATRVEITRDSRKRQGTFVVLDSNNAPLPTETIDDVNSGRHVYTVTNWDRHGRSGSASLSVDLGEL